MTSVISIPTRPRDTFLMSIGCVVGAMDMAVLELLKGLEHIALGALVHFGPHSAQNLFSDEVDDDNDNDGTTEVL
jgi:hypothetical protein